MELNVAKECKVAVLSRLDKIKSKGGEQGGGGGGILKFFLLKWKVYVDKGRLSDGRNLGECVSVGLSSVTSEEKILFRHGGTWIRARMRNKPAIIPMLQRLLHPSGTISGVGGETGRRMFLEDGSLKIVVWLRAGSYLMSQVQLATRW